MATKRRGQEQKREQTLNEQEDAAAKLMQCLVCVRPEFVRPISAFSIQLQSKLFEFIGELEAPPAPLPPPVPTATFTRRGVPMWPREDDYDPGYDIRDGWD